MKQREWVQAGAGAVLATIGAWLLWPVSSERHTTENFLLRAGPCEVPTTFLKPAGHAQASAVVFHGLGGSRGVMRTLGHSLAASGANVYLVDFPGHGDSTDAFSYGRVGQCAAAAVGALEAEKAIHLNRTVLIGHSLGGATAVRLADRFSTATTIAISPAPMELPRRMPVNLLVISARYDLPTLRRVAQQLVHAAGGVRDATEDLRQRRAVRFVVVPAAQHASLLLNKLVWLESVRWWQRSLGAGPTSDRFFGKRIALGTVLGAVGLMLMFPLAASALCTALRVSKVHELGANETPRKILTQWAVAAMFAAGLLKFWTPLAWLKIYNGDYLASFLLLAGVLLAVLAQQRHWQSRPIQLIEGRGDQLRRALVAAAVLGIAVTMATAAWVNWELTDVWPIAERWWRLSLLVVVFVPYLWAEEKALGPPGQQRIHRWALYLAMRALLWLAMIFGLFVLDSGAVLMLLFLLYLLAISVLQRLGSDAVRKRTGSALAAALFGAIVAAWFVASVFPIT